MRTWLMIIAVLILSGTIAYLGDLVGRRVGKQRLTLFGLRPRYTSIIITIVTGVLIAAFSIAFIFTVFSNVRNAVFNIQDVLTQLTVLSMQVRSRDSQLKEMEEEIAETENALNSIRTERALLQQELDRITRQYEAAQQELDKAAGEYLEVQREIAAITLEYEEVQRELYNARREIEDLEQDKEALSVLLEENQQLLAGLEEQREDLEEKVLILEDRVAQLQGGFDLMEKEYNMRFKELQTLYYTLGQRYQEYTEGEIIYLRGEEIYRAVINGGQSEAEVFSNLEQFIQEANRIAQAMGVKAQDPETGRSVAFYIHEFLAVARELHQREGRFIVSLIAENNTVPGQELRGRFRLIEDYVVYRAGDVIFEWEIRHNDNPHQLEEEINEFFYSLRNQALADGMLPDYYGEVGSIDFIVFYNFLVTIRESDPPVNVKVVANQDIWRNDALNTNIDFQLVTVGDRSDTGG